MNNTENVTIGLLVITAVILAALVFVQTEEPAYAASPDRGGNYVVIAGQVSSTIDLVYVVNGATKTLLAYGTDQKNRIRVVGKLDLEKEFRR